MLWSLAGRRDDPPPATLRKKTKIPSQPPMSRRLYLLYITLAIAIAGVAWTYSPSSVQPVTADNIKLLLGPSSLGHGGTVQLEQISRGNALKNPLPRLHVIGGRTFDEAALVQTYTFLNLVLKLRRPFTCVWDPRPVRWPALSGRMFKMIRTWVDANAEQWDTHVQAHALILTNPVVRSLGRLVISLFAPPQPIRIVKSEAEALEWARTCCAKTRSWVKVSYADRDQRFSIFGSRWSGG